MNLWPKLNDSKMCYTWAFEPFQILDRSKYVLYAAFQAKTNPSHSQNVLFYGPVLARKKYPIKYAQKSGPKIPIKFLDDNRKHKMGNGHSRYITTWITKKRRFGR